MGYSAYTNLDKISFVDDINLIDKSKEYIKVNFYQTSTTTRKIIGRNPLPMRTKFYLQFFKNGNLIDSIHVNDKIIKTRHDRKKGELIVVYSDNTEISEYQIQEDKALESISDILKSL